MTTRSRARKLPSSSSSSSSESDNETLDLERIMDEGVLHNTDNPKSEDIMQKPNNENALDIATPSKDQDKDITGALTENNIMQQSMPTDQPASKTSDAGESDHTDGDKQQDEGNDIMRKSDSQSDSEDNMTLADILRKGKRKKKSKGSPAKKKKTDFSCSDCRKHFLTKNRLYKHEITHGRLKHFCATCGKVYFWNCELEDHEWRHTDKRSERIKCKVPKCKKDYSSKRALQHHVRDDHGKAKEVTCDFTDDAGKICGRKSKTMTLHKQHYMHAHEGGFVTFCGERVPWPNDRQMHQATCKLCLDIQDNA